LNARQRRALASRSVPRHQGVPAAASTHALQIGSPGKKRPKLREKRPKLREKRPKLWELVPP